MATFSHFCPIYLFHRLCRLLLAAGALAPLPLHYWSCPPRTEAEAKRAQMGRKEGEGRGGGGLCTCEETHERGNDKYKDKYRDKYKEKDNDHDNDQRAQMKREGEDGRRWRIVHL